MRKKIMPGINLLMMGLIVFLLAVLFATVLHIQSPLNMLPLTPTPCHRCFRGSLKLGIEAASYIRVTMNARKGCEASKNDKALPSFLGLPLPAERRADTGELPANAQRTIGRSLDCHSGEEKKRRGVGCAIPRGKFETEAVSWCPMTAQHANTPTRHYLITLAR